MRFNDGIAFPVVNIFHLFSLNPRHLNIFRMDFLEIFALHHGTRIQAWYKSEYTFEDMLTVLDIIGIDLDILCEILILQQLDVGLLSTAQENFHCQQKVDSGWILVTYCAAIHCDKNVQNKECIIILSKTPINNKLFLYRFQEEGKPLLPPIIPVKKTISYIYIYVHIYVYIYIYFKARQHLVVGARSLVNALSLQIIAQFSIMTILPITGQ